MNIDILKPMGHTPKTYSDGQDPVQRTVKIVGRSEFLALKQEVDRLPGFIETSWRRENADAIASSNAYVAQHGLPLRRLRKF